MSKVQDRTDHLKDVAAERLVLSSLFKHGEKYYYEIDGFLKSNNFTSGINQILFDVLTEQIRVNKVNPSISAVLAKTQTIDTNLITKYDLSEYLENLTNENLSIEEGVSFAKKVAKISLIRNLQATLLNTASSLGTVNNDESLRDILVRVEQPLSNFTTDLVSGFKTVNLVEFLPSFAEKIPNNKNVSRGIPSGLPLWDKTIGGGLRVGVNLVGARSGQGKSFLGINVANHTINQNIPTLYLDTELSEEITLTRFTALISGETIDDIEGGTANLINIDKAIKKLKDKKFFYHNISGTHHSHWISEIRKWIIKDVGFKPDGSAKDCLVVLDYIKVMDLTDGNMMKEYQYLGQIITDLHNCCVKFNLPILSLVQLNRDGINNSGEGTLADSDRLLRLCSSFSIFRKKEEEDLVADPSKNGNRKILTVKSRFGAGMDEGEYINMKCDFSRGLIQEGQSNINNRTKATPAKVNTVAVDTEEAPFDDDTIPL